MFDYERQGAVKATPDRFMAYNNGIVLVADEARMGKTADGGPGLLWLKGMQIVNGGQTTASIYFTRKKDAGVDLGRVRVPAKIIVLRSSDTAAEERLIADISRFANSQNAVKVSDLSANKPFHVELEKLATTTYTPDGVGRWFYERAAGSYNVLLAREGTTPARLRKLKETIPTTRKITKTDLAKYLNAWEGQPHIASLGAQKNFERFMEALSEADDQSPPDVTAFKHMVAKAIVFRTAHRLTKPFRQVQAQLRELASGAHHYVEPGKADPEHPPAITAEEATSDLPAIFAQEELAAGTLRRGKRAFDVAMPYHAPEQPNDYVKLMRSWSGYEGGPAVHDQVIRYLPRDYQLFAGLKAGDQYPEAWRYAVSLFETRLVERRQAGEVLEEGTAEWAALRDSIVPPYDASKFPNKWRKMERDRPARTLLAHLGKDGYGSAPSGACGAAGRSTALPAMQRRKARRLLAAFSLAPR